MRDNKPNFINDSLDSLQTNDEFNTKIDISNEMSPQDFSNHEERKSQFKVKRMKAPNFSMDSGTGLLG